MTSGGSHTRRKYLILVCGLAALLAVGLVLASSLLSGSGQESASTSLAQPTDPAQQPGSPSAPTESGSGTAEPEGAPSQEQTVPAPPATSSSGQSLSVRTDTILPAYQDVPLEESVTIKDTVTARVSSLTPAVSDGRSIGEVNGPALAVAIEVRNDSGATVDLNMAGASLSLGPDLSPASPLPTQSMSAPFSGELASGQTATGTYVFLVPEGSPQDIRVEVTYGGDRPVMAFTGTRP